MCAPSFLTQEVANSLWRAVKLKRLTLEAAQEALKLLNDTQIQLIELNWAHLPQALIIACDLNLTIYDAVYLLLCEKTKAQLITADEKLYESSKMKYKTLHIKDYE